MNALEAVLHAHGVSASPSQPDATVPAASSVSLEVLRKLAAQPGAETDMMNAASYADASCAPEWQELLDLWAVRYERAMRRCGLKPYPASPSAVAAYLEGFRHSVGPSTRAKLASVIRSGHLERGFEDPTVHEIVRTKLESMAREGAESAWSTVQPLLVSDYLRLRASIPRDLCGLRDRVAIGIGFEGFLFAGPITEIDVENLLIDQAGVSIALRNPRRPSVVIPRRGSDDVIGDLEEYLAISELRFGALFRRIRHTGNMGKRLQQRGLGRVVLRKRLTAAGFDARAYNFSSLRTGHLISAEIKGVDELQLASRASVRTADTMINLRRVAQTFVARSG